MLRRLGVLGVAALAAAGVLLGALARLVAADDVLAVRLEAALLGSRDR